MSGRSSAINRFSYVNDLNKQGATLRHNFV